MISFVTLVTLSAQTNTEKKLYDEDINPMTQIDNALKTAKASGKYVICQVGANWCKWCYRFDEYIKKDAEIAKIVNDNFVYIHVNYDAKKPHHAETMKRLANPGRFGFPNMVVLDSNGKVLHIQDSSFLESGESYDKQKTLRFFNNWTPKAVTTVK